MRLEEKEHPECVLRYAHDGPHLSGVSHGRYIEWDSSEYFDPDEFNYTLAAKVPPKKIELETYTDLDLVAFLAATLYRHYDDGGTSGRGVEGTLAEHLDLFCGCAQSEHFSETYSQAEVRSEVARRISEGRRQRELFPKISSASVSLEGADQTDFLALLSFSLYSLNRKNNAREDRSLVKSQLLRLMMLLLQVHKRMTRINTCHYSYVEIIQEAQKRIL